MTNRWVGQVTFSFTNAASDYENPYVGGSNEPNSFSALNATQQAAARTIFGMFGAVVNPANLSFLERTGAQDATADIRMANSNVPPTAWAYLPGGGTGVAGDVWFGTTGNNYANPVVGNYAWAT